jgi:hypothetical protein
MPRSLHSNASKFQVSSRTYVREYEYRVEDQIKQHSDTVRLWQKQLDKTYDQRSRVETAIGVCKDLGLRTPRVRGRVRVKAHVFLVLCLRLAVALANHH